MHVIPTGGSNYSWGSFFLARGWIVRFPNCHKASGLGNLTRGWTTLTDLEKSELGTQFILCVMHTVHSANSLVGACIEIYKWYQNNAAETHWTHYIYGTGRLAISKPQMTETDSAVIWIRIIIPVLPDMASKARDQRLIRNHLEAHRRSHWKCANCQGTWCLWESHSCGTSYKVNFHVS